MTTPRPNARARGYDKAWFRLRARHLQAHPFCVMCRAAGVRTMASHVDHIVSIRLRPDLRLNRKNLQSLCDRHHDLITRAIDSGDVRGAADIEGMPLDPDHPWAQGTTADAIATVNRPFAPKHSTPELTARLKRQALGGRS